MVLAPRWRARISPISAGQACSVWAQVPLCHRVILVHRMSASRRMYPAVEGVT
jgi:hypothetical protein